MTITNIKKKRARKDVLVVTCPNDDDFRPQQERPSKNAVSKTTATTIDLRQASQDVFRLGGGSAYEKQEQEQHLFAGSRRPVKRGPKVPLPILRGIKKKAQQREQKRLEEARQSGLVLPSKKKTKQQRSKRPPASYGPAPSIGYLRKGVLRVSSKNIK